MHFYSLILLFLLASCGGANQTQGVFDYTKALQTNIQEDRPVPQLRTFEASLYSSGLEQREKDRTYDLGIGKEGEWLSRWMLKKLFYRFHTKEGQINGLARMDGLESGVIIKPRQSLYHLLVTNNEKSIKLHFQMDALPEGTSYRLALINDQDLSLSKIISPLNQAGSSDQNFETNLLSVSELLKTLDEKSQLVVIWDESVNLDGHLNILTDSGAKGIPFKEKAFVELGELIKTNEKVYSFDDLSTVEELDKLPSNEDFWICFPCQNKMLGTWGEVYLIKTSLFDLIASNRMIGVKNLSAEFESELEMKNLKAFDLLNINMNLNLMVPTVKAYHSQFVSNQFARRGESVLCFRTAQKIDYVPQAVVAIEEYLESTFIVGKSFSLSLADYLRRTGQNYELLSQSEIQLKIELLPRYLEEGTEITLVTNYPVKQRVLNFLDEQVYCDEALRSQSPSRQETAMEKIITKISVRIDGSYRL